MAGGLSIYVAGPIGESTDFRERFTAGRLEVAALGHHPVTPIHDGCSNSTAQGVCGHDWLVHMKTDIRLLLECDGIYLLRGWENSRGARLEKLIADGLGLLVLYQPEEG